MLYLKKSKYSHPLKNFQTNSIFLRKLKVQSESSANEQIRISFEVKNNSTNIIYSFHIFIDYVYIYISCKQQFVEVGEDIAQNSTKRRKVITDNS